MNKLDKITPAEIIARLRAGELITPADRPILHPYGLKLVDGQVGWKGIMFPARAGGGYSTAGIMAPEGHEWVQVEAGTPAYHGTAVLVRLF